MKIGVLGAGQLGRMLALAALPRAHEIRLFDPDPEPCAAAIAPVQRGDFGDERALARFAEGLDVVTCEFENVPVATLEAVQTLVPVFPKPFSFAVAQDRLAEKDFLNGLGIRTAPYARVDTLAQLQEAARSFGLPAILKTRRMGYDGRGQCVVRDFENLPAAFQQLGAKDLLLEGFVNFDREVSVLGVRSRTGEMRFYPLCENEHQDGILAVTRVPARVPAPLEGAAKALSAKVLEALDHVGVLCVELFQQGETLIANEIAPRVHNSGHWTIEGATTSQFDNHLRAICGLPLGAADARGPTAMVNLVGHLPELSRALAIPETTAHFYGKSVRAQRKVGHLTIRAQNLGELETRIALARQLTSP